LEGCEVHWCESGADAISWLSEQSPDLVVCDIRLPDRSGEEIFAELSGRGAVPPFLFVTGYGEIDQAVRLMRAGANDYVTKPFEMDKFLDKVRSVVERRPLPAGAPVLGVSPQMEEVESLIQRLAGVDSTVLITGETGAGKDVSARLLHRLSPRSTQPFVAVNCAAIPGDLLESEIFGHEAGAFTGATKRHRGYAERAGKGILFLDEIGSLPLALQAKLLRLIESASFLRVGGEAKVPFKARLVAATNADLAQMVKEGSFREDLYYRINVVEITVPPLRERPADIRWLMDMFFVEFATSRNGAPRGISSLAEEAALEHDWPGNVRELRNRVERAVALALGEWVMPGDLFPERGAAPREPEGGSTLAGARENAEKRRIQKTLLEHDGQIVRTAEALGISRTTLWEKMRKYGLS
ncbi:MAG: sigma-54-dependent Fis family transcriptional regulator, partial [Alphaproteobacteria bacterium]